MDEFLNMKEVVRITGLSRQQLWRDRRAGTFPEACQLGPRRVGFLRSEIETWITARKRERDEQIKARKEALK